MAQTLSLDGKCDLSGWKQKVQAMKTAKKKVKIAIVGKYVALRDSYISLVEAVRHAAGENGVQADLLWVDSETVTNANVKKKLKDADGVIVPGGFGTRGVEGMIAACKYARETGLPYLGICLGMQISVIEFARDVAGIKDATSGEFLSETNGEGSAVIDILPEKKGKKIGGTMRLGAYPCVLSEGSRAAALYGKTEISERHRHRYEFCNDFRDAFVAAGLIPTGLSPNGRLVEIVELPEHPWFTACQFHPEFKSRPDRPHPLFLGFVEAAASRS